MNLTDRINSFVMLGEKLGRYHENSTDPVVKPLVEASNIAFQRNPWFTPEHIRMALNNLGKVLTKENLSIWLSGYASGIEGLTTQKRIGVVMAGNIPAVGFHDFLCVLLSGHKLLAKLSSSDDQLLPAMAEILTKDLPEWKEYISFTSGKLEKFDAIIATGSTNTSRYFEFYFGKYPHVIRRSRNSIAVLSGNETQHDLQNLANDIMLFFGMGCRSISKLYVPTGYDFSNLFIALNKYEYFANHHKYRNNYDYCKSVFMVSQVPFIDTGYLLLTEDEAVASRIAVLHYEFYDTPEAVDLKIRGKLELIQCVISNLSLTFRTLHPGGGQIPALWDYADQTDTMEFLIS